MEKNKESGEKRTGEMGKARYCCVTLLLSLAFDIL